jgi:hypothetical protein
MARNRKLLHCGLLRISQVKQIPTDGNRPRYTCIFFNDDNIAYVPLTGLYDFVQTYG